MKCRNFTVRHSLFLVGYCPIAAVKAQNNQHMRTKTFTIKGSHIEEPVLLYIRGYNRDAYETQYPGGFLRVFDDYSFLNGSYITICLRVDTTALGNDKLLIEIITSGASGSRFIDRMFGTERRRIQDFEDRLLLLCEQKGFEVESKE